MKYHSVYKLSYYDDRAMSELRRGEAQYLTPERIEKMLEHAHATGVKDGEIQGRNALRVAIEKGEIQPIRRNLEDYPS